METAVTCRIETTDRNGMTILTGIVESDLPIEGHAALDVGTRGLAGQSRNVQRNAFAIGEGDSIAVVGRIGVSTGPNSALTARLRVEWDGGEAACDYP